MDCNVIVTARDDEEKNKRETTFAQFQIRPFAI